MDQSLDRKFPSRMAHPDQVVPPGWYTCTCDRAGFKDEDQPGGVTRCVLRCEFPVASEDGPIWVSMKPSPEEWRKDPTTRRSIKVTDESGPQLDEYPLDYRSRLYHQVEVALQQQGATITTPDDVREALTRYPLRFQVAVFKPGDDEPRNWVKAVAPPQGTPQGNREGA